jgi:hypothetical protein
MVLIFPSLLRSTIQEMIKMAPDTYEFWGQSPGGTKTITQRNFTFFNFTNPRGFLYHDEKPNLTQVNGYLLQERFNFTDYKYSDDMSEVFFNNWMFFTEMDGTRNFD